jgi:hypothetical protein
MIEAPFEWNATRQRLRNRSGTYLQLKILRIVLLRKQRVHFCMRVEN